MAGLGQLLAREDGAQRLPKSPTGLLLSCWVPQIHRAPIVQGSTGAQPKAQLRAKLVGLGLIPGAWLGWETQWSDP